MCFFVKDAATSDIYPYCHTLSLHDALPIWDNGRSAETDLRCSPPAGTGRRGRPLQPCRTSARPPRGRTHPGGSNGSDRCCGGCTICEAVLHGNLGTWRTVASRSLCCAQSVNTRHSTRSDSRRVGDTCV